MVFLTDEYLIAEGGSRRCYLHPGDDSKVVKVVYSNKRSPEQNANNKEWRYYQHLLKRHGKLDYVNECFGFEETNLGTALVCSAIRDDSGCISRDLSQVMSDPRQYDLRAVDSELTRFFDRIVRDNIQLFDLNPKNIVVRAAGDGSYQIVAVDLKGRYANHEFIPVSTHFPFFSRRKLLRRIDRLMNRLRAACPIEM